MSEENKLEDINTDSDGAADEVTDDLASFVDIADLDSLEDLSNAEIFGDLGDLSDLGDIPDLSALSESGSQGNGAAQESVDGDVSPSDKIPLPEEEETDAGKAPLPEEDLTEELSATEEVPDFDLDNLPDLTEDDSPSVPDLLPDEDAGDTSLPDADTVDAADVPLGVGDIQDLMLDDNRDMEDDAPSVEEADFSDDISLDGLPSMDEIDSMDDIPDLSDLGVDDTPLPDAPAADAGEDEAVSDLLGGIDLGFEDAEPLGDLGDLGALGDIGADTDAGDDGAAAVENLLDASMVLPEEKKPGFFKRVFGNVVTDEIAEQEKKDRENAEEKAAKKAEEDAQKAEEKAKKKAEEKAEKQAKKEEQKKKNEQKKAEEKAKKEQKAAEKKAEQEKEAEVEVVGKLNRVGVTIIVVLTIAFLAAEIGGTNAYGYQSTKKRAMDYFEAGNYTEAYQEALGTDMKEKDAEDYDRIKTVMQVQQPLNAYESYDRAGYYPEALNALLTGLSRYDLNIDNAMRLEVDSDMADCRRQIVTLLSEDFSLSESQAYDILALDEEAYNDRVVEIGLSKVN